MKEYEEKALNIMDKAKEVVRTQLDKAYTNGYNQGYTDAKNKLGQNAIDLAHEESDRAYQQGLEDAWKAAGELYKMSFDEESELFGTKCPYFDFSVQEILNIIKEYEKQQKKDTEIKVGDEVYLLDESHPRVVTNIFDNGGRMMAAQISTNGKWVVNNVKELHKTGRHFPQIAEVLAEMRGK